MLKSKISENTSTIHIYGRDAYQIHHSSGKSFLRITQTIFTKLFYISYLTIGTHPPLNVLRVYSSGKLELVLNNKVVMIRPNEIYKLN